MRITIIRPITIINITKFPHQLPFNSLTIINIPH